MELSEAVLIALIGGGAGLGGAFLGSWITARGSKSHREEAAKARAEAREDARQQRFADERRNLLTDFWLACNDCAVTLAVHVDRRRDSGASDIVTTDPHAAQRAYLALLLIAPSEVVIPAARLLSATVDQWQRHHIPWDADHPRSPVDETAWARDEAEWTEASLRFLEWAVETLQGAPIHG